MSASSNTDHAHRFAKKSAEASLGYAHAGTFAGMFAFNALVEAWTDAYTEAVTPSKSRPKSWFRDPAKVDLFDPWGFWTETSSTAADPWSGQNWGMTQAWSPVWWTSAATPFATAWAELLPNSCHSTDLSFTRSPFWDTATAALPLTWSLMSFGMPHAVAKPTAEANTAALEAMDSAQHIANDQMTAYTSALKPSAKAPANDTAANPFDAYALMFWPWLAETATTNTPTAA